jgi:hypothetical protein
MKSIVKKLFLLCFCSSLAFGGFFDSATKWEDSSIESKENSDIGATIFLGGDNQLKVGITMASDECTKFEGEAYNAPGMLFNGTMVQMYAQCISNGLRMDFPRSNAGVNYITNEFKTKDKVVISQDGYSFTFSTKGFSKEYKKEYDLAIAEANGL